MVVVPKYDGELRVYQLFLGQKGYCERCLSNAQDNDPPETILGQWCTPPWTSSKGYHQLFLHLDSKPATASLTPNGLYQLKEALLEMKTALAVFQRVMDQIMQVL